LSLVGTCLATKRSGKLRQERLIMKCVARAIVFGAAWLALGGSALAQRVPATGSGALGGDVGVFVPRQTELTVGPTIEGFYEYYLTPRNSLRMGLGWSQPKFDLESSDSLRHVRVALDTVYNWEGGAVHPFVGAGLGVYFLQFRDNGSNAGDSETKLGGTLFGGAEFFTGRTVSVKAEARYHLVQNIGVFKTDGLALTIGLKSYF
jgi:hypothetical protein